MSYQPKRQQKVYHCCRHLKMSLRYYHFVLIKTCNTVYDVFNNLTPAKIHCTGVVCISRLIYIFFFFFCLTA